MVLRETMFFFKKAFATAQTLREKFHLMNVYKMLKIGTLETIEEIFFYFAL